MMYKFSAKIVRTSEEDYELVVEASNPTAALDLAEATLETFPHGRSANVRYCLRTTANPTGVEIIDIEPEDYEGT